MIRVSSEEVDFDVTYIADDHFAHYLLLVHLGALDKLKFEDCAVEVAETVARFLPTHVRAR